MSASPETRVGNFGEECGIPQFNQVYRDFEFIKLGVKLEEDDPIRKVVRVYGLLLAQEAGIKIPKALTLLSDKLFQYYEEHGLYLEGVQDNQFDNLLLQISKQHLEESGGRSTVRRALVFPGQRPEIGKAVALGCTTGEEVRDGILAIFNEAKQIKDELLAQVSSSNEDYHIYVYLQEHQDPKQFNDEEVESIINGEYVGLVPIGCYAAIVEILPGGRLEVSVVAGPGQTRSVRDNGDIYTFTVYNLDGFIDSAIVREKGKQRTMLVATNRAANDRIEYPFGEESLPVPATIQQRGPLSLQDISLIGEMMRRTYLQIQDHEPDDSLFKQGFRIECQWGRYEDGSVGPICTELEPYRFVETEGHNFAGKRQVIEAAKIDDLEKVRRGIKEQEKIFIYIPPEVTTDDNLRTAVLQLIREHGEEDKRNKNSLILFFGSRLGVGHGVADLIQAAENWELHYYLVGNQTIRDGWLMSLKTKRGKIESLYRLIDKEKAVRLRDIVVLDPEQAGRKARTLAAFLEECQKREDLGLEALEGLLIPRSVITDLYLFNGLREPTGQIQNLWKRSEGDMEGFEKRLKSYARIVRDKLTRVPDEWFEQWLADLEESGVSGLLICRSATGLEDGFDPWAGAFDSVTRVEKETLKKAIIKVARSLWGERAINHLVANYSSEQVEALLKEYWMSIVIQEFKDIPALGGVNFVIQSRSRNDDSCIEISFTDQDCSQLVNQDVGETIFIERETGNVFVARDNGDGGNELLAFDGELPFDPLALHRLALQAEKFLGGRTADIEGGSYKINEREIFPLYQLRPVAGNGKQ